MIMQTNYILVGGHQKVSCKIVGIMNKQRHNWNIPTEMIRFQLNIEWFVNIVILRWWNMKIISLVGPRNVYSKNWVKFDYLRRTQIEIDYFICQNRKRWLYWRECFGLSNCGMRIFFDSPCAPKIRLRPILSLTSEKLSQYELYTNLGYIDC